MGHGRHTGHAQAGAEDRLEVLARQDRAQVAAGSVVGIAAEVEFAVAVEVPAAAGVVGVVAAAEVEVAVVVGVAVEDVECLYETTSGQVVWAVSRPEA